MAHNADHAEESVETNADRCGLCSHFDKTDNTVSAQGNERTAQKRCDDGQGRSEQQAHEELRSRDPSRIVRHYSLILARGRTLASRMQDQSTEMQGRGRGKNSHDPLEFLILQCTTRYMARFARHPVLA
jgi:hypothetical protein